MDFKKIGIILFGFIFYFVVMELGRSYDFVNAMPLFVAVFVILGSFVVVGYLMSRFPRFQPILWWVFFVFLMFACLIVPIGFILFIPQDPLSLLFALLFIGGFFLLGLDRILWIFWGTFLFNRGWYSLAEAHYSNLIRFRPKMGVAYQQRAISRQKQKKLDGALSDLNRAVDLSYQESQQSKDQSQMVSIRVNWVVALNDRANLHLIMGNFTQNLDDLNRILTDVQVDEINPTFLTVVYLNRGISQLCNGNYAEALSDLEYIKSGITEPRIYEILLFNLALTYQALDSTAEAQQHWHEAIIKNPNFKDREWIKQEVFNYPEAIWTIWKQLADVG